MKFVNKELAIKLKEKGFDKPCFGWYYINAPYGRIDEDINYYSTNSRGVIYEDCLYSNNLDDFYGNTADAPIIEQVLKWLREEKDIMVFPAYSKNTSRWYCEIVNADSLESEKLLFPDSYEDACIAGIEYAINNLI